MWHCAVGGTFSVSAKIVNVCGGFFDCLMEATKEVMLQHTWFEMKFLAIIGNTYFSLLCLPVYSCIVFGVWWSLGVLGFVVWLGFYLLTPLFLKKRIPSFVSI